MSKVIDFATILGFIVGLGVFTTAGILKAGENPLMFIDLPSAAITFGGTIGAILIYFPFSELVRIPGVLKKIFVSSQASPEELIQDLANYADIARRDGILALERVTDDVDDEFLIRGIQLAVDGNDPEVIQYMLSTERDRIIDRHESGKKIFSAFADLLPSMGMAGTVMGLIVMLKQLDNPSAIGSGMALALMTTFYGALSAFLIFKPIAQKLKIKSDKEILLKNIIIEGIMSIQSGDNPRIVKQKLLLFLSPSDRQEIE